MNVEFQKQNLANEGVVMVVVVMDMVRIVVGIVRNLNIVEVVVVGRPLLLEKRCLLDRGIVLKQFDKTTLR